MEMFTMVLLTLIGLYVVAETIALILLYRNRAVFVPRIRKMVARFIGTSDIGQKLKRIEKRLDSMEND